LMKNKYLQVDKILPIGDNGNAKTITKVLIDGDLLLS
jgi:hypothetical protein